MGRRLWGCAALAALSVTAIGCDGPRQPWRHQVVSVTADGTDAGGAVTSQTVMSADGTKVAFVGLGGDFGVTDTNGTWDVYVRDLTTATTTLVSADAAGTDAGNGSSMVPAISADGARVAFLSQADDLGPTDTHRGADVYVRDLTTGTTTLVSANAAGTDASTGTIFADPVISPDGTKVVFSTSGGDLGPTDTRATCLGSLVPAPTFVPCPDVYLRDLAAGTTELLTVNAAGTNGADYGLLADLQAAATFSPDSSKVALVSTARDLVGTPVCCASHVFVRDLVTDTTVLAPAVLPGMADPGGARDPAFSPDGSQVVFDSTAADPSRAYHQVFLHDLGTGDTTLVSAGSSGTGPGDGPSGNATFGPDGVYFQSHAGDLVPGAPPGANVYRRDIEGATTTLVAADATAPAVSPDGRFLGFVAQGGGHGPTDTNGTSDVYRLDLRSGTATLVSTNGEGTDASGSVPTRDQFQMTADGNRFLFGSGAGDLGPPDTNGQVDAYVADLGGADLALDGTAVAGPVGTPERLIYSLEVTNAGPEAAEATTVALLLPEGTELSSAPDGCTEESRVVTCEVGTLAPGTGASMTVRADAGPAIPATAAVASSPTIEVDGTDNALPLTP